MERLVDVLDIEGNVLHTYPISLGEGIADDAAFEAKALQAAGHGRLVADDRLPGLTAKIHTARSGRLQPYGDNIATDSETKSGLEEEVRRRAYFLWKQDGKPQGQTQEYWDRAREQHLQERAYVLWQQTGSKEDGADEDWHSIVDFEVK